MVQNLLFNKGCKCSFLLARLIVEVLNERILVKHQKMSELLIPQSFKYNVNICFVRCGKCIKVCAACKLHNGRLNFTLSGVKILPPLPPPPSVKRKRNSAVFPPLKARSKQGTGPHHSLVARGSTAF